MKKLYKKKIHLASKSPRRSYLLKKSGFKVKVLNINVDESFPSELLIKDIAEFIARKKAEACLLLLKNNQIGVTADTIVAHNNKILEKPKNHAEAFEMLQELGGNNHTVYTGVCIIQNGVIESFTVASDVFLKSMTAAEINYYIEQFQPYDKAGSYGIQEWIGYAKIDRIEGSYSNIMGLPMAELYEKLAARMNQLT